MRRTFRFVLPIAVYLSIALSAAIAVAAPAAWDRVDVTLHADQSGGVMLISGQLPETTKLPAEAELSVPAGSELQWIGQILGGDASADPPVTYTKSTVGTSEVYRFTLTESRIAQVEVKSPSALGFDGTSYTSALTWTPAQDIPEVRVSVRVPQSAQIVQAAAGASLEPADAGFSYYTKTIKGAKAGDQLGLPFSYQVAAAPAAAAGASSGSAGSAATVIIVLIAVVAFALLTFAVRRKASRAWISDEPVSRPAPKKASGSPKSATTSAPEQTQPAENPARGIAVSTKRNLVTAGIIGTILVIAVVVGGQSAKPQAVGDEIMRTFSGGEPCETASISVAASKDSDPSSTAEKLFAALEPLEGINNSTYRISASILSVGYCESKATEDGIRQALAPTGLVTAAAATTPAPVAASEPTSAAGSSKTAPADAEGAQALTVDTSTGVFSPTQLTAKAGSPISITFGQGTGCLAEVVFPDLGVRQSLESGPVAVTLPALDPGTYTFQCGHDMQRGTLVVQ